MLLVRTHGAGFLHSPSATSCACALENSTRVESSNAEARSRVALVLLLISRQPSSDSNATQNRNNLHTIDLLYSYSYHITQLELGLKRFCLIAYTPITPTAAATLSIAPIALGVKAKEESTAPDSCVTPETSLILSNVGL